MQLIQPRRTTRLVLILGVAVAAGACGDDEDSDRSDLLDPDVPPITNGNWYQPAVDATWQWQLLGAINTSYTVDLYDIDLVDAAASIAPLQAAGAKVICYFSGGSAEDWRDDFNDFDDSVLGEPLDGWEDERWLDIRKDNVLGVMRARLDRAVASGCDGVEPDNMDGYSNDSGFSLTAEDQQAFNRYIANEAHLRDLTVGLKNDGDQAALMVDYFDFSLNEQCHEYAECGALATFPANGKPILNAEYEDSEAAAQSAATSLCPQAATANTRTLILPLDLDDSFRVSCN